MGLKPLSASVDQRKRQKLLSPSTACLKPASPTIHEQGLTAGSCGQMELSTVSTAVINTTNPKKLISLKQQSRSAPRTGPGPRPRTAGVLTGDGEISSLPAKLSAALPSSGFFVVQQVANHAGSVVRGATTFGLPVGVPGSDNGSSNERRHPSVKFRVERDVLAEAVTWTARSLSPRPPVPVLSGPAPQG